MLKGQRALLMEQIRSFRRDEGEVSSSSSSVIKNKTSSESWLVSNNDFVKIKIIQNEVIISKI